MARGPLDDLVDMLPNLAIIGGLGWLVLHRGVDGTSLLDRITQAAIIPQLPGLPGAPAQPTQPGSPSDPTQAPSNQPGGNAFDISNVSAFRHFDGLWYVDGDVQHIGGGGTFVGQLDLREAGVFGLGAGQYQRAGTFTFDVPQDATWTTHHISSGDQGMGGPPTFFGADALFTIAGLSGEQYTHRQIGAQQGGV